MSLAIKAAIRTWAADPDAWSDGLDEVPPEGRQNIAEVVGGWGPELIGSYVHGCPEEFGGWAFWLNPDDTTSYLNANLRVEWYGSSGPAT